MSQEGLDNLKEELLHCQKQTQVLANEIEHARSYGDLRENSEYHAAKENQAKNTARMRDLEDKIARAVILDDSEMDTSKAYMGATVRVRNLKTKKEATFILVGPTEADIESGKLSLRSPIGQALAGNSVGDTVVAKVPAGDIPFEILEITR